MSVLAALALSAAALPAMPPADAKAAPVRGTGGLPAQITAIGSIVVEILRPGTNGPAATADALDRRIRRDAQGGTVEYQ